MTGRYLVELADWLRGAGLTVEEYPGWEYRARSSGGYADGRPWCVMWHHTASDGPPGNDAAYIAEGSPDAPLANLLIDRQGVVYVIAAGATNTNGKGYALTFSRGTVPNDQMNTYAVGIEVQNSGVGQTYPRVQVDAVFAASLAIARHLGLAPADAAHHHDWAPDRKVDNAVAGAVDGPWQPRSINSAGSWSLTDLRAELAARAAGVPPDPPPEPEPGPGPEPEPPEEDGMQVLTAATDANGTLWIGDGVTRFEAPSMDVVNNYIVLGVAGCYRFVNASGRPIRQADDIYEVGDVTIAALGQVTR